MNKYLHEPPAVHAIKRCLVDEPAYATMTDGPITLTLTLTFRFQGNGLIGSTRAESRGRLMNGVPSGAPWQGRFWNYAVRDGMRMPLEGDVAWVMPDDIKPCYRDKLTSLLFECVNPR